MESYVSCIATFALRREYLSWTTSALCLTIVIIVLERLCICKEWVSYRCFSSSMLVVINVLLSVLLVLSLFLKSSHRELSCLTGHCVSIMSA
jgi:hypothetical protein